MQVRTRYGYASANQTARSAASAPPLSLAPGIPGGGGDRAAGHGAGHGGAHRRGRAAGGNTGHGGDVAGPLPDGDGVPVACGPPRRPPGARGGGGIPEWDLSARARGRGRGSVGHPALSRAGAECRGVGRDEAGPIAGRHDRASGHWRVARLALESGSPANGPSTVLAGTWGGDRERRGRVAGAGVRIAVGGGARPAWRRAGHGSRRGAVVQRRRIENRRGHPRRHWVCGRGVCAAVGGGAGAGGSGVPGRRSRGLAAFRHRRALLAPARIPGVLGVCAVCGPSAGSRPLWHRGGGGGAP